MAFEHMSSEAKWVLISNNDVRYERHWFSEILKVHEIRPDIQSFSPKEPALYAKNVLTGISWGIRIPILRITWFQKV